MDDWGEHFALRVNDDSVDVIEDDDGFFKTRPGASVGSMHFSANGVATKYKKGLG